MSKFAGKALAVQQHDGSALRNISTAVSSATVPGTADTPEVTGGGSEQKSYVVGLRDSKPKLEGSLDDAANGQHAVMVALQGGTAGYEQRVSPRGTSTGNIQCKGTVLLASYEVTVDVGDAAKYSAEFVPFDNQIGMVWGTI